MSEVPDRPWTEEQYLAEFRRSDVSSAKFGELLDTLRDDPNCDALIAREMGWDREPEGEVAAEWLEELSRIDEEVSEQMAELDDATPSEPDEPVDLLHADDAEDREEGLPLLSDEPAFQAAVELAHFVIDLNRRHGEWTFADDRHDAGSTRSPVNDRQLRRF